MKQTRTRHASLRTLFGVLALGAPLAVLAVSAVPLSAHDGSHLAVTADEVVFNPGPASMQAGAEIALLLGSPAEEGPFVVRLRFPAGFEIAPHRHVKEEHVTVISGGFGMATGETFDRTAGPVMPPGSFVQIPAGEAHFAWTEEETVVQLNGTGPFTVEYVNPADDPRRN